MGSVDGGFEEFVVFISESRFQVPDLDFEIANPLLHGGAKDVPMKVKSRRP
jgi:hypothetical protein